MENMSDVSLEAIHGIPFQRKYFVMSSLGQIVTISVIDFIKLVDFCNQLRTVGFDSVKA